jgi:hypothetical protein
MLQRIQSLYLFSASLLGIILLFYNPIFLGQAQAISFSPFVAIDGTEYHNANHFYGVFVLAVAMALLYVVFLYKNRTAQIKICRLLLLLLTANTLIFASLMICYPNSITLNYSIFATPAQAFLVFLALRGIKKDEEKVRSVDRIR